MKHWKFLAVVIPLLVVVAAVISRLYFRHPEQDAYERAVALIDQGKYAQAVSEFNDALRLSPGNVPAYAGRAEAYRQEGNFDAAIQDETAALQLAVTQKASNTLIAELYTNRGVAYGQKGCYAQAITDYATTVTLAPNNSTAQNNLAWLLATAPDAAVRNGTRAIAAAQKACELTNWKEPTNLDTLAAAYAEAGDFPNAVKWQRTAVELLKDPQYRDGMTKRVSLYTEKHPYREYRKH